MKRSTKIGRKAQWEDAKRAGKLRFGRFPVGARFCSKLKRKLERTSKNEAKELY